MPSPILRLLLCVVLGSAFQAALQSAATAQVDSSGIFKFLPKYEPGEELESDMPPPPPGPDGPVIAWKPELRHPDDPSLEGRSGKVWVKALVNANGRVADAQVLLSPDTLFNRHALAHVRMYRFAWPQGTPPRDSVRVTLPVVFTPRESKPAMTVREGGNPVQVERLGADRVEEVVATLSDAFAGYPVIQQVLGTEAGDYDVRLATLVRLFVMARVLRNEAVFGIPNGAQLSAVAIVSVPGGAPPSALVEFREKTWEVLGMPCRFRYEAFVTATAPFAADAPHLHLNMIGVRRSMQGKGRARPLLESVHALCRSTPEWGGVSLTTEDRRNLALYERFGYRVIGHAVVAPELESWGMYRPQHTG